MEPSNYAACETHRHELLILASPDRLEYRVLGKSRTGPQRNVFWSVTVSLLLVPLYALSAKFLGTNEYALLITSSVLLISWWRSRVLWESLVVYPSNGIQLEICRGFTFLPTVSREFIPNVFIQDVIINEGLRRWTVRYYLALVVNSGCHTQLHVAFKETLPHFPILIRIYQGVSDGLKSGSIPSSPFQDN